LENRKAVKGASPLLRIKIVHLGHVRIVEIVGLVYDEGETVERQHYS